MNGPDLAAKQTQRRVRLGRRFARTLVAGALSLIPVGVVGGLFGQGVSAAPSPLSVAAEVPIKDDPSGANTGNEVMMDVGARRVLYWSSVTGELRAYDLDTFSEVASTKSSVTPNYPWTLDPQNHILFHFHSTVPPVLEGVNTQTLATVPALTMTLQPHMGDPYAGLYWSQRDSLLYMVYAPYALGSGNQVTMVAAIDPSSTTNPVLWTASVTGCGQPLGLTANNAAAIGQTKDGKYIFTVCKTGGGSAAIARLTLPADPKGTTGTFNGATTLVPGLVTGQGSSALWIPNLDRLVTMVQSNGGNGWSAYIFDASSMHFVSAPGLFTPPLDGHLTYEPAGFGVDPASGRMIAQSRAIATQGRDPQSGAACQFYAGGTNTAVLAETSMSGVSLLRFPVSDESIRSFGHFAGLDPVRHNWWMFSQHMQPASQCNPNGTLDASYFVVFHDAVPPAVPPPSADPDNSTSNIPEQTGTTGSNASSEASAYGTRYVLGPSGADGLMATPTNGGTCDLNADFSHDQQSFSSSLPILGAPPAPPQYHSFCNSHGRTATFAHVDSVSLDSSEARASAITGDTDRETANDIQVGTDVSQPGLYSDAVAGYANGTGSTVTGGASGAPVPTPCPASTPAPDSPTPSSSPTPTPAMTLPNPPSTEPTTCDQQLQPVQPFLTGIPLPYAPARCGDNGTDAKQQSTESPLTVHGLPNNSPLTYPGSASVACSFAGQTAAGHAQQVSASVGGPLSDPVAAMSAISDVNVKRDTTDGSMATSTATVKDISVGSFLHITSLTASATATAHGRPGTNGTVYSCQIHGLTVSLPANVSLPDSVKSNIPDASCGSSQVRQLVDALNGIFSGQMNISFPAAPTPADNPPGGSGGVVQRRSPRGYLSEVALSDLDQTQNAILINDPSIEKPAMVVTLYLDNNYSRNRLVTSFAGVAATARYGIFPLDSAGGDSLGSGSTDSVPDSGVLTNPVDGSGSNENGTPPVAETATPNQPGPGGFNPLKIAQAIVDGFRFLLQHPELIPPVLAVWLLLVSPGYLLARRRALVSATEGAI